jgi:large subunit ribosomal protein L10
MARPDKTAAVAELADEFRSSSAAVLTEYRGLTVAQLKELRRSLGENASYAVVKNTLTKIAASEAGVSAFDDLLQGPSAIAFVKGDPVEAAKGLRDFAKAHPLLVIKGGVLDGKTLSADEIRKLADVEPREVLLAKLAGAMKASLTQAAALFQAPLSQAARTVEALRAKAEADPSVLAGGAGAPAAQPEAASAADGAAPAEESADPAQSAESAESAESAQSAESTQATEPAEPAEPTASAEPAQSADSTEG